jgi:hypothetical protein
VISFTAGVQTVDPAVLVFMAFLSGLFLFLGLRAGRRRRLLDDTPTSKTLGIFIGEVEVEGVCISTTPIRAKFCYQDCVVYSWGIDEEWQRWETVVYTDSRGRTSTRQVLRRGWTTIASDSIYKGFYIKDEFGYVWVHPKGADCETLTLFNETTHRGESLYSMGPDDSIMDSTGRRRFYESGLPISTPLFVRGRASERPDIVAPQIVEDPLAEMFIITYRKEKDISSGKATAYVLWNLVGLVTAMGIGALLTPNDLKGLIIGVSIYSFAWFAGWVWMVFNSLIGLRNRVQQAQSLIDVQLKRRSDLIPPLIASLKGLRDYEAQVQTEIATLRGQSMGTNQVSALVPGLKAIIEKYPELIANESFNALMKNLTETEDRIALARNYANDVTTFYNTRLERIPDRFVAQIVAMQPALLFVAQGFEHKVPDVKI